MPLATGDEVIKFWKVKGQGQWGGMRSTECPSSYGCFFFVSEENFWHRIFHARCSSRHATDSVGSLRDVEKDDQWPDLQNIWRKILSLSQVFPEFIISYKVKIFVDFYM